MTHRCGDLELTKQAEPKSKDSDGLAMRIRVFGVKSSPKVNDKEFAFVATNCWECAVNVVSFEQVKVFPSVQVPLLWNLSHRKVY